MQLLIAFGALGLLLWAGTWILRPVPPARLRGIRDGAAFVLRPPRGRFAILATLALGPTILVVAVVLAASRKVGLGTTGMVVAGAAVLAGLSVFAYFLVAERRVAVRVDDRGVVRIDPFGKRVIAWGDLQKIAYNGVSRWFFLSGSGGVRLWVPENMAGIGDFAEVALAHVAPALLGADGGTREALEQLVEEARGEDEAGGKARA